MRPTHGCEAEAAETNQQHCPGRGLRDGRRHIGEDELVIVIVVIAARSIFKSDIGAGRNRSHAPCVWRHVSVLKPSELPEALLNQFTLVVISWM